MAGSRFTGGVSLGTGIGLRVPHYRHILAEKPAVDWFEIISENYMVDGGRPLEVLDRILEQYRVVQHGVGLYPGNANGLDFDHLRRLKRLVKRTGTPWLSDHLCWGSVDGSMSHDLLPLPFTFESVRKTAENLRIAQDFLEVPLAVENVSSYAEFHDDEMTEWEFLAEVVEAADIGILLDVNNIYVSSFNHGFDPMDYVNFVPPERVAQIHIAGHSKYERFIIDTHDHAVVDPVWHIYARAIERCGSVATLLEWDARIPSFEEVWTEAKKSEQWRTTAGNPDSGDHVAA
ncbi:DUF692 domain-containing protein [Luteolibacter sp. LG18]|uniref:MNIO family bufferin maturase n=1 Tax=Luteolibacter sp. LG18 TaxID=2819286 RepID=UPI002B2CEFDA|nr:UPF0276 protein [Luteolibacter sp. LG18]